MKILSTLEVAHSGNPIGHLLCAAPDRWTFQPAPGNATAVGLPVWSALARQSAATANHRAWFRGLLPDGLECARLALWHGVSVGNEFALLGLRGNDCQGGLSFALPGGPSHPANEWRTLAHETLQALATGQRAEVLDHLPWLLPGDARQFPCGFTDGQISVSPAAGGWIARVGREGLDEAVENEALCMRLAAALGLPVPATTLWRGPTPVLLARRVDREEVPTGNGRRHLEDFCQLSALHPEQAYEREGGLAVLDCANLIRRYSQAPALDIRALLSWLVFSFLVGVGQAHARTLCLIESPRGPRLALNGGLLSTHVYPNVSERMAMYIGKEDRPDWIRLARWREMAEELGIGTRYMLELLRQMAVKLPPLAEAVASDLQLSRQSLKVVPRILKLIANRARQSVIALEAERT